MLEYVLIIFFLGTINLLKLVWSDLEDLTIDARPSWLMSGVVLTCFWLGGRALEMVIIAFVFIVALGKIKKYIGVLGLSEGDATVLAWVIPAMWLFGLWHLIIFLIGYVGILSYFKFIMKKNSGIPATIPITIGFCVVWACLGLGIGI